MPLVFVRNEEAFVVANARPAGERRNPWVTNLRAAGRGSIRLGKQKLDVVARELDGPEAERWWSQLVRAWPAFAQHYAATHERAVFLLVRAERPSL